MNATHHPASCGVLACGAALLLTVSLAAAAQTPGSLMDSSAQSLGQPFPSRQPVKLTTAAVPSPLSPLPDDPSLLRTGSPESWSESSAAASPAGLLDVAGSHTSTVVAPASRATLPQAPRSQKYIEPGQAVTELTAEDKVVLGLRDAVSPFAVVGWFGAAGYEQALNSSPNYGTDRGAYGERVGAAVLRDSSEEIFSDSVLAPVLHEDPRYYRMGDEHPFFVRVLYAGTRPLITKSDSGRFTPNYATILGNLAGSALARAYYPPVNRNASATLETFGGSLGGSAAGDVLREFYRDLLQFVHRRD